MRSIQCSTQFTKSNTTMPCLPRLIIAILFWKSTPKKNKINLFNFLHFIHLSSLLLAILPFFAFYFPKVWIFFKKLIKSRGRKRAQRLRHLALTTRLIISLSCLVIVMPLFFLVLDVPIQAIFTLKFHSENFELKTFDQGFIFHCWQNYDNKICSKLCRARKKRVWLFVCDFQQIKFKNW